MNPDTLSRYGESDIRQEIFRMSTQVILFFLSAVTAGLVIVIAYQRFAFTRGIQTKLKQISQKLEDIQKSGSDEKVMVFFFF